MGKSLAFLLLLVSVLCALSGCQSPTSNSTAPTVSPTPTPNVVPTPAPNPNLNTYRFSNLSSYSITITPVGQYDWSSFILGSQKYMDVTIAETSITYQYNYASYVNAVQTPGEVIFVNK